ncbi:MAG: hypothetical protein H0W02_03380 [Ktedonobacteraceae bacterium]|nr:hypothetical protein [Ktedonobacteraceae bacterium]
MVSSLPLVIIQSIQTIWTKASRGGDRASARNRTPEACKLPAQVCSFPDTVFLLHQVVYSEHDLFQHPVEKLELEARTEPFRYDCLKLLLAENTLRITVEWERSEGAPRRVVFPRKEIFLQEQQWARVTYNLRTSWESGWIYKKRVHNIGFFAHISPGIFLEGEPVHTYRDMAHLW